jgi:hypothetical protein
VVDKGIPVKMELVVDATFYDELRRRDARRKAAAQSAARAAARPRHDEPAVAAAFVFPAVITA